MTLATSWSAPSNIALVKYWGKHGLQLPRNPSLSFTLSSCRTIMRVEVTQEVSNPSLEVNFQGQPKPSFAPKINSFFQLISAQFPWLTSSRVVIDSHNTFPHGAGIASSASSMAALALCLVDIHSQISGELITMNDAWWRETSTIARIGSGSACRSVFSHAALWGHVQDINDSSDEYALPWAAYLHPFYASYRDTILVVSSHEKSVSSTAGHKLMDELPYAAVRYDEAHSNTVRLIDVLKDDTRVDHFVSLVESEALQLHALMMSGPHPFLLMEPNTISIIREVWRYRKETGIPVCFTLDAGPNVHLLYPSSYHDQVMLWVRSELSHYCHENRFIEDAVGTGPVKMD